MFQKRLKMKHFFTLLVSFLTFSVALAQVPANDEACGAIDLAITDINGTCPTTVRTNRNATNSANTPTSPNASCFNGASASKDVWYKFTTPASGLQNYRITVQGVNTVDSLRNPQVALYRGDCNVFLDELYCNRPATLGTRAISIDASGLDPNTTYFIQVAGFQATDPAGDFTICVKPFEPVYVMTAADQTATTCTGVLYDSGGPLGNYGNSENRVFNIRPTGAGCVQITIDSLTTEFTDDSLMIFDGVTGLQYERIMGTSNRLPITFQVPSSWVQVRFRSDASVVFSGFKLTWACSALCNAPLPTSCATPDVVPSLPFSRTAQTTCNDNLDEITDVTSACTTDEFFRGREHVYKYTSTGGQCIRIRVSGIPTQGTTNTVGMGIFYGCPTSTAIRCIQKGVLNGTRDTVTIANVRLEAAGDYYIVLGRVGGCMPFNISIDTVSCLNILPAADACDRAAQLNDCSPTAPSDVRFEIGGGDPNFLNATNRGCVFGFGGTPRFLFTYFQAQANGRFNFTIRPAVIPAAGTDIDYNVWGPIPHRDSICSYIQTREPIRSNYDVEGATTDFRTGLADTLINSAGVAQIPTDTFNCRGGDNVNGIVRGIQVRTGEIYVIWFNDFRQGINSQSGVRMDFTGTTSGVLQQLEPFAVTPADTAICPGGQVNLRARGGARYSWSPSTGLSSAVIANPIARPTETTEYSVNIQGTCRQTTQTARVTVFEIRNIPDQEVCRGEELRFDVGSGFPAILGAVWSWTSPTGHLSELSCTNCPNPTFVATNTSGVNELHSFTVTLTTPNCVLTKTFNVTVAFGLVPQYAVATSLTPSRDTNVCINQPFNLLKPGFDPTATFAWTSSPVSTLTGNNPSVSPQQSRIKYYVTATAATCPFPSRDSVIVNVFNPPVLSVIGDTTLCKDADLTLSTTARQTNTRYRWTPNAGFTTGRDTLPATSVTVLPGLTTYTLTATNIGRCTTIATTRVTGVDLSMALNFPDTISNCRGNNINIVANTFPANLPVNWSSDRDFGIPASATNITVNPPRNTRYRANISIGSCVRRDSVFVRVDSLPSISNISPQDTAVCKGEMVLLKSPSYEPFLFPNLRLQWGPREGLVTNDALYNMVVSVDTTRTYSRLMVNGVCRRTDTVKVTMKPLPFASISPADTTICNNPAGNRITLRAIVPTGSEIKWNGPTGQIPGTDDRTSIVVSPTAATNAYSINVKKDGCSSTANANITVKPLATFAFPTNTQICKDSSLVLNTAPNAGFTYAWSLGTDTFSRVAAPIVTPTTATRYGLRITRNGCITDTSINVTVVILTLNVTPVDTAVCAGDFLKLTANGTTNIGTGGYRWSLGGTTTQSIDPPTLNPATYTVTYSAGGCAISRTANVRITPNFTLAIVPDTFSRTKLVDLGTQINLTAVPTGNFGNMSYSWTRDNSAIGNAATQTVVPSSETGSEVIKVSAVSGTTGCKKDATTTIFIRYPNFDVPNAFSPNGDGINAFFAPVFDDPAFNPTNQRPRLHKGNIKITSFQVFDRWGSAVYDEANETTLNATTYQGWDGKRKGVDLPSDVYVYLIKLRMPDGTERILSGELNLIK